MRLITTVVVVVVVGILFGTIEGTTINELYTNTQTGPGTYYGAYTSGGACTLDPTPSTGSTAIFSTVAMVSSYYFGSEVCGMCISVYASGVGSGSTPIVGNFTVFVNNECPTCNSAGLDFGNDT